MIEVQGVSRRYGSVEALREVSLRVADGQVLGLLGQNGAGKTTLLNLLTGYLAPTRGRVLIDGHDPLLEPEAAKRRLGYLPEHPPLYDEMTVREYLAFAAALRQVRGRAIVGHVAEIMRKTGLTEMQNRLLGHLSKGYRQRVGMAQALCGDPDVLVLDEPTVGLDPKQITEIRQLIHQLAKGRTIVFSSHILSEVQQLCDHVVILHRGEVKLDAPIREMSGGDEITVLCTIQGSEKRLVAAANHLEGVRRVTVRPSADPDEVNLTLSCAKGSQPERALFTLCSGLSAPILRLTRGEDDLEQIFLNAISQ